MSHIEKEKLIKADIASIENKVRHAFNQGYDLGFKDGKEKAKPLAQEPFKPMVEIDLDYVIRQKYIEREVLDKIRAEIEETYMNITYQENSYKKATWGLRKALEIIDKYKGESEG